ncbi:N-acetylmuramoyl-L-alanine amidase [Streptomyces sp. IB2014 016-6]|uniref:peptidoglycan recognition protein family protein n=1 Tax=Streptomyces sp. IB2014 016-6 TaxID=2517818 RepID=UPI0011C7642A|nr:N-acetylmuramoyl-L-alanine amidase [Streptomyces sp. IB2014 016-6]TXL86703.1 N-acetylmuramoyl-L-alanine amidase [Streptomyces sp. IB2014 016-6]
MVANSGPGRRTVLRGGLTATAVGALGLAATGPANAAPVRRPAARSPLAAAEPRIYSTAEWGARPPSQQIVVLDRVPTYIVVHHTAEPGNSEDYSLEHAMEICRSIQNFHMDGQGWGDSGQQFTNSRGGFILEGRHQSLDVVRGGTQHVQGANVGGRNSEVIGIENEGLYTEVDVPAALWGSLVQLVAWIATQYGRPVTDIMGHRDFNSTECPGGVLYGRLQELRDAVAGALGVAPADRPSVWPLLRPGAAGPQVRAAQYLLRARGFEDVPVDGVFGAATKRAVVKLADVHNVEKHTCAAMARSRTDETGYLGSDIWPLITPKVRAGEDADVEKAVTTLHRAGADRAHSTGVLTATDWKHLLA